MSGASSGHRRANSGGICCARSCVNALARSIAEPNGWKSSNAISPTGKRSHAGLATPCASCSGHEYEAVPTPTEVRTVEAEEGRAGGNGGG